MADTTSHETELTRAETAEFLRSIADELEADRDRIRVAVGNKNVRLSPPERIATAATVTERSRRFRKDVEELELRLKWTPTKATAEATTNGGPVEHDDTDGPAEHDDTDGRTE